MDDDFSELVSLAADLTDAGEAIGPYVEKAVEVTARGIKDDWRQAADRTALHGYAASVDYDMERSATEIAAEIGPNLSKSQGPMGFVEDGGTGVASAPQHAGRDAAEANEPDFYRGLEIAAWDAAKAVEG